MNLVMFEYGFWMLVSLVAFIYFAYPIYVWIAAGIAGKVIEADDGYEPMVTMIITAHNEEAVIEKKIYNSLELDYPRKKLEIIVASDGSTDDTEKIVKSFEGKGIGLFSLNKQEGKTIAQNKAVVQSKGEFIVFSDANGMYNPGAIRKLVRNFADDDVGCVCGELCYYNIAGDKNKSEEQIYWAMEKFFKKHESRINSIIGVNGSIYAIRKNLYESLDADVISDLILPITIYLKGYRIVYEPEAISHERSMKSIFEEFSRKKRIVLRSILGLFTVREILNPFKYKSYSLHIYFHKLLRWLTPFFLLFILLLNYILIDEYATLFYLQFAAYAYAVLSLLWVNKVRRFKFLFLPSYVFIVNLASFIAVINAILGKKIVVWEPVVRSSNSE